MKESECKEKFIQLRVENKSFDKISDELNVSKPTLIKWSKEFQHQIANLKAVQLESIRDNYLITREHNAKLYRALLDKVQAEIEKKEFTQYSFESLMTLYNQYSQRIENELKIEFTENVGFKVTGMDDKIEKWIL